MWTHKPHKPFPPQVVFRHGVSSEQRRHHVTLDCATLTKTKQPSAVCHSYAPGMKNSSRVTASLDSVMRRAFRSSRRTRTDWVDTQADGKALTAWSIPEHKAQAEHGS